MSRYTIGQRVGAIFGNDNGVVKFLGYGTYQGWRIPDRALGVGLFGIPMEHANPCIQLDSGKLVFGCECWWGPEEQVRRQIDVHLNVVEVDIEQERWKVLNQERGALIDKNIAGTLDDEERVRLEFLNAFADRHIEAVAPRVYPDINVEI